PGRLVLRGLGGPGLPALALGHGVFSIWAGACRATRACGNRRGWDTHGHAVEAQSTVHQQMRMKSPPPSGSRDVAPGGGAVGDVPQPNRGRFSATWANVAPRIRRLRGSVTA